MQRLLLLLLLAAPMCAFAQAPFVHTSTYVDAPGSEPREHPVDMLRMTVDVRFEPEKGLVKGTVTHVFRSLRERTDSIEFDAIKIRILQATLGGKPVRTRSTDTTVIVYCEPAMRWDTRDSVTFIYEANPRKGIYFVGWNDPSKRMRRQIWTQGQGIDNRHWIPMYDEMNDKMITETITTFDSSYAVLSNGTRGEVVVNGDGTKTWRYSMTKPHASYLLMLAIGQYSITTRKAASGVPLYLYTYSDQPERTEPTYRMSVEAMDFLERETGIPYPWESYSQVPVADYIFGAMENTTATVFGDFFQTDSRGWLDRSYVGVNVHELTHQWFGDLITGRSGKSIWLQESFATFYPHLFTRLTLGEDAYEWSRRGMHRAALAAGEKDRLPIVHPSSGSARVYPKGASVIDMMRYTFGDSSVRRVIQHYLRQHAYGNVETNDLYLAFQDTLGLSPDWFFDQWLYKGGEPHFKISTRTGAATTERGVSTTTLVDIEQIHPMDHLTGVFRMPVVIEVHYTDRTKDSIRVDIASQRSLVELPNPGKKVPAFILFDPGSYILKRVTFDRSWDARVAQMKYAPHMIDRFDAFETFRGDTARIQDRLDMIEDVMDRERFHAMRSEAVGQAIELALIGNTHALKTIERGLKDPAVEVRSSAINGLTTIPLSLKGACERLLEDSSYAVMQSALMKLVQSFPSDARTYLNKVKAVRGPHERVHIARLEAEAADGNGSALAELSDLCGPGWEFITRQNAMGAMRRLSTLTEEGARNILLGIVSTNTRLSGVAQATLTALTEQPRLREVVRRVAMGMQVEQWQRDMLIPYTR
ncbi:MAG: M1 family metallopeptidase [Candidatus Kapabacteria bacterium]|nr:M1 family metallopeptidase [Ignavibacteria bacterium]MBP6510550.1 M1 family metallopeptidase [Candidatus Kapabacteria bacterium]MBK6420151.1 M1 family metallopeptidase [Ignavibacteria bacterium]MBK6759213.1 M1 family metallopeptidase [Ignavibacteria bacterium]MBK7412905.1 M1 family metallopeptidase [Ignavibacteria bacterium]